MEPGPAMGYTGGPPQATPPQSRSPALVPERHVRARRVRLLPVLLAGIALVPACLAAVPAPPAQVRPPDPGTGRRRPREWPGQGDPQVERARRGILRRESGGNYRAVDPTGTWFGGYQLHLHTSNGVARRMQRPDLVGVPASRWPRADQDAAFYLLYDRGRGRRHWFTGRRSHG